MFHNSRCGTFLMTQREARRAQWHNWFAWRPVVAHAYAGADPPRIAFLETVERREVTQSYMCGCVSQRRWIYLYGAPGKEEK
jgi:hypothetical protein